MPRTAFALVSWFGVSQREGSSAECAARNGVPATVDTAARAYTRAVGPPEASTTAIRPIDAPRTTPIAVMARSRRTRSAIVAKSGPAIAPGSSRISATRPTAVAPPSRNATMPSPTVSVHSEVHAAPNESWARRRSRLRRFEANASRTARIRDRAAELISPAAALDTPRAYGRGASTATLRHGVEAPRAVTSGGTGADGLRRGQSHRT